MAIKSVLSKRAIRGENSLAYLKESKLYLR